MCVCVCVCVCVCEHELNACVSIDDVCVVCVSVCVFVCLFVCVLCVCVCVFVRVLVDDCVVFLFSRAPTRAARRYIVHYA